MKTQMKSAWKFAAAALLPATLTGCGNMSGLIDAHDSFGCPAQEGFHCASVSQTYGQTHGDEAQSNILRPRAVEPAKRSVEKAGVNAGEVRAQKRTTEETNAIRVFEGKVLHAGRKEKRKDVRDVQVSGFAARAPEEVAVVWILPWVDAAGDLHSESRIWMRLNDAKWRIEMLRTRAAERMRSAEP